MGLEWLILLAFVVFAYLVVWKARGGFFFSAFGDGFDGDEKPSAGQESGEQTGPGAEKAD